MSAGVQIRARGLDRIVPFFDALEDKVSDLSPLMERIGVYLEQSTDLRFEREREPSGRFWKKSIRARETGGTTLSDSGRLRGSITSNATASEVEVGTNVLYAGIHQFGGTIRAKGKALAFTLPGIGLVTVKQVVIPARPFLGLTKVDEEEVVGLAEDYLVEAADGAA